MLDRRLTLPRTELSVSRLCLGGNRFGGALDQDRSFALLDAFLESGGNFIDTAHVYADWIEGNEPSSSEKTIGRWLRSRRPSGVVVATKGGHPPLSDPHVPRLEAAALRRDVEESLDYLGRSTLDLFYVHRDDPKRPVEDVLGNLENLRRDGLVRHYGASNWSTARLWEAQRIADAHGWQGFVANQAEWSLAIRNPDTVPGDLHVMAGPMVEFHQRTGMASVPYSSQARGYFDKVSSSLDEATARLYDGEDNRATARDLTRIAGPMNATPTQLMLAVLIRAPFPVVPVIGCRTPEQVRSSFASLSLVLAPEQVMILFQGRMSVEGR